MNITVRQKRIADRAWHSLTHEYRELNELEEDEFYEWIVRQRINTRSDVKVGRRNPDKPFETGNLCLFDPDWDNDCDFYCPVL